MEVIMKSFNTKVYKAAALFLSRRGYEIIDEPWKEDKGMLPVDIVAREDDTVVFVRAKGQKAEESRSFNSEALDRDKLEAFAVDWFEKNADEYADCPFRFDAISMVVITEDKALLRHHINALCVSCCDPEED